MNGRVWYRRTSRAVALRVCRFLLKRCENLLRRFYPEEYTEAGRRSVRRAAEEITGAGLWMAGLEELRKAIGEDDDDLDDNPWLK